LAHSSVCFLSFTKAFWRHTQVKNSADAQNPGAILAAGFYKLIKVLQAENEDSNDNEREPLLS